MQSQLQPTSTQQTVPPIVSLDPALIVKSDSPTAVILAIAILISMLIGGITGLARVMMRPR